MPGGRRDAAGGPGAARGGVSRRVLRLRPRRWPWLLVSTALLGLVVADHKGWLLVRGPDDLGAYHGAQATVMRVIDGDLIELALPDRLHGRPQTQVRLWGVQCRRAARPDDAEGSRLAEEARRFTRTLAEGRTVELTLEPHRTRAGTGQVLAHVRLPDGSILNESLLAAGLARTDDRLPHSLLGRYEQMQQIARRQRLGIWE